MYNKEELEEKVQDRNKILNSISPSKGVLDLVGHNDRGSEHCFNLAFPVPKALEFRKANFRLIAG